MKIKNFSCRSVRALSLVCCVFAIIFFANTKLSAQSIEVSPGLHLELPEDVPPIYPPKNVPESESWFILDCRDEIVSGAPTRYDVDGDHYITILDIDRVLVAVGSESQHYGVYPAEDVNADGFVDQRDVDELSSYLDNPLGETYDECGVCGGDGTTCLDCLGIPNGTAIEDECRVCGGPGKTGCDYQCGSTKVEDECGVCGGPGKTGCDYQCGSTKEVDCKGVCGGSTKVDDCGICGGSGKSGCDQQCGSAKIVDDCGICGGDGSSCKQCDLIGLEMRNEGSWGVSTSNWSEIRSLGTTTVEGRCLNQRLDDALLVCARRGDGDFKDDCVMANIARTPLDGKRCEKYFSLL